MERKYNSITNYTLILNLIMILIRSWKEQDLAKNLLRKISPRSKFWIQNSWLSEIGVLMTWVFDHQSTWIKLNTISIKIYFNKKSLFSGLLLRTRAWWLLSYAYRWSRWLYTVIRDLQFNDSEWQFCLEK